jgi:hypothetical protein
VSARIARLLHANSVAAPEKDGGADAQRRLGSRNDEHLFRLAPNGASRAQVVGDRGTQCTDTSGITVRHVNLREPAGMPRNESRPELVGKLIESRKAHPERPDSAFIAPERYAAQ